MAACTVREDRPATVTLPELDTTTVPEPTPDSSAPSPQQEPPPVAWVLQVGGPGDDAFDAVAGVQDRVVAVGSTDAGIDAPSAGAADALAAVASTQGELVSVDELGSSGADRARGVGGDGGGALACGDTEGDLATAPGGSTDLWCARIDPNGTTGDESWSYGTPTQLGTADAESVGSVAFPPATGGPPTPDGEPPEGELSPDGGSAGYAAGSVSGLLPGAQDPSGRGLGGGDALALQVDGDGTPVWARQFGTGLADGAAGAAAAPDGDGLLVGFTDGPLEGASAGARDAWMTRFDTAGNQRWITQVGGPGNDEFRAVAILGEARRGTELFVGAGVTDDDVDSTGTGANAGGTDAVAAGFASDGALSWITQFGGVGADDATGVVGDGATVYVAGTTAPADGSPSEGATADRFGDTVEDGGPGGGADGFLAGLDAATGEVVWVSRFGSELDERVSGITTTEDGLVVVSGTTAGQIGEDPPAGGDDGFLIAFPLAASGGGAASSV